MCQIYLHKLPNDLEVNFMYARARMLKGDSDIAINSLLHCQQLDPSYPDVNLGLAEAYEKIGNHMSALESYTKHITYDDPTCKKALLKYVLYSAILTRFQEAHEKLDILHNLYSRDASLYFVES